MDEQAWRNKSVEILTDIKEWRRVHPKATYVEIEDEVHKRMMELEAQILQDAAQASPSREWGKTSGQQAALCPTCAVPLQARGKHKRTLQGNGGQYVTLSRTYGTCPKCGQSLFPLDDELVLLPGSLAPRQQEHLAHLACFMPFDKAAQMIEEILSVHTNEETVRQLTERIGACMEAVQTVEAEPDGSHESHDQPPLQRCVFSADGAMISLVHTQWAETRTVAIGELEEQLTADDKHEIHVGHLSYFSRLADASTFLDLAEVEMRRRKVKEARQVCAVMDGADWLQVFTDRHRPDALRILDFPHAAEHTTKLLEALEKLGRGFPPQMLQRCLHVLKHRGPHPLLQMGDRLESSLAQHKEVNAHLDYLRKREALMQYPVFRHQGWPIGSGMVESANKNIVEARLKGAGMHWERNNVNPMLALRNAVCNDRWQEMWQQALQQHRHHQALHRTSRAEQRAQSLLTLCNFSLPDSSSPPLSAEMQQTSASVPPPLPTARPSISCPSTRRKRHTARNRVKYSHQRSGEVSGETCFCGTPLVRLRGHRTREYCSDRCRQRAYRQRQAKM